jgi:hypothetical protein
MNFIIPCEVQKTPYFWILSAHLSATCVLSAAKPFVRFSRNLEKEFFTKSCPAGVSLAEINAVTVMSMHQFLLNSHLLAINGYLPTQSIFF